MNALLPPPTLAGKNARAVCLSAWLLCGALGPVLAQTNDTQTSETQPTETQTADPAPPIPPADAQPTPLPPAESTPAAESPVSTLSFTQVQAALRSSPGWRSAEESFRAAQLSLDAARARAGLNLTVGGSASASKVPVDGGDWNGNVTLSSQLSAAVLPYGSAYDGVRNAQQALARAALTLQDTRQTLTLSALQTYLSARTADVQARLSAAQVALATRRLEVAQAQRDNGVIRLEDLLTRQGELQTAQANAVDASASREISTRQLLSDLGLDVTAAPSLTLPSAPSVPNAPAPLDTLLARAGQSRIEIGQATSQLADAQSGLTSARRERLPNLSASVNYGELGGATGEAGRTVGGSLDFKTGVAAASLSLPLKDSTAPIPTALGLGLTGSVNVFGRAENAAIASAQSGVRSAELALQSARSSVDLDVRRRYNDAQSTLRLLDVQRSALSRAQTTLASSQARLSAGLDTTLDVQAAELAVQSAQLGVDQAVNNAYLAARQLDKAAATLDTALILAAGATP